MKKAGDLMDARGNVTSLRVRGVVVSTLDFRLCDQGSNPCRCNDEVNCSNYCINCKVVGRLFHYSLGQTREFG